jgi:hypothetical protein
VPTNPVYLFININAVRLKYLQFQRKLTETTWEDLLETVLTSRVKNNNELIVLKIVFKFTRIANVVDFICMFDCLYR